MALCKGQVCRATKDTSGGCPPETVSGSSPRVPSQNYTHGTNQGTESMIGCPHQALGVNLSTIVHSFKC